MSIFFYKPYVKTQSLAIIGSESIGLQIGTDGNNAGDFVVYGEAAGSYMQWDNDANEQGRFKVVEASTRLTCSHHDGQNVGLGNECCLSASQSHNVNTTTGQTQGGHGIWSKYELPAANTNASEASTAIMAAVHGQMILEGTLNGDKVQAVGVFGETYGTPAALTECDFIAAVYAKNQIALNPSAGDSCLFLGQNISGTIDYGLMLEGSITTGISIGACTTGIKIEGIGGTTQKAINIGGTTPLVYTGGEEGINVQIRSNYTGLTGFFRGLYVHSDYTPSTVGSGAASVYGIRGHATLHTGCTHVVGATGERLVGVDGAFSATGATLNSDDVWVAGTRGALFGTGTWTKVKFVSAVLAACQLNPSGGTIGDGIYSAFAAYSTSIVPDTVMNVHGSFVTFLDLTNATEGTGYVYDKVTSPSTTIVGNLVIRDTDGSLGYINVYSDQGDAA